MSAVIDRLEELREQSRLPTMSTRHLSKAPSMDENIKIQKEEYENVKKGIQLIVDNTKDVEILKARDRKEDLSSAESQEIMQKIQQVTAATHEIAARVKIVLTQIKDVNNQMAIANPNSTRVSVCVGQYQSQIRVFHEAVNTFRASTYEYQQYQEDRQRLQLKIAVADKGVTDDQIEMIARSGHAEQVISESLFSESLAGVISELESKNSQIRHLEHQVNEIHELYRDLSTLVQLQAESLEVIEDRVHRAKAYTEKATRNLASADRYQKIARNRRVCATLVGVGIMVALLILITGTEIFTTSA